MRRLLCLPQRVCDAVENANRGISELRLGIRIVVKDAGVDHEQNPSLRAEIRVETTDEEDWVIVDWDETLTPSKERPL